jgi:hypothetical protein
LPVKHRNDDKRDEDQAQQCDLVRRRPELTLHAATPKTKSATARCSTRTFPAGLRTYVGIATGRLSQTGTQTNLNRRFLILTALSPAGNQVNGISQSTAMRPFFPQHDFQ